MKVQNLNKSSMKTRQLIKKVFAEMLSEKKELGKISVSELCKRADISRGSFYSHYDDIYGVAEEYENEMIDTFFDNARLFESQDIMHFIDSIFEFIRQNHENYRLLCKSNDFLFAAKKLAAIASNKLLELSRNNSWIQERTYIELDLQIFLEGLLCEYVKYCRGYSSTTLDDLYEYTKYWAKNFITLRSKQL
ncbi:MAG: TetR/AcrR family transcriptional regulator [Lachnospiraceae bacterium]|nr:TetR/AcrR family transcriptional regulator [Lachnospiraceae bacterium]